MIVWLLVVGIAGIVVDAGIGDWLNCECVGWGCDKGLRWVLHWVGFWRVILIIILLVYILTIISESYHHSIHNCI